jgi:hypothetical protein
LKEEPVRLHPNLAALYHQKVARLHDLLGSDATRTETIEIIRSLVDQVTFRATAEGGLEIELVGHIARMVHLAQNCSENSPIAAVHDDFACSVKVVAGARNHLNLFFMRLDLKYLHGGWVVNLPSGYELISKDASVQCARRPITRLLRPDLPKTADRRLRWGLTHFR